MSNVTNDGGCWPHLHAILSFIYFVYSFFSSLCHQRFLIFLLIFVSVSGWKMRMKKSLSCLFASLPLPFPFSPVNCFVFFYNALNFLSPVFSAGIDSHFPFRHLFPFFFHQFLFSFLTISVRSLLRYQFPFSLLTSPSVHLFAINSHFPFPHLPFSSFTASRFLLCHPSHFLLSLRLPPSHFPRPLWRLYSFYAEFVINEE